MSATVTVLYPQGVKFNMDYYLQSHMPMVKELWGPDGLKSWKVLKFPEDQPYAVQATLEWGSFSDFEKASKGEHLKKIIGDVENFSDKPPTLMPGHVVGSS